MSEMSSTKRAWLSVGAIILFFAVLYVGKRQFLRQLESKNHPFEVVAHQLDSHPEWCDQRIQGQRILVAQVLDRFLSLIEDLRMKQKVGEKEAGYFSFGSVYVHPKPTTTPKEEFDRSVWSWTDVYSSLQKTQDGSDQSLWLDIDLAAKFLLKLDSQRIFAKKKFLSPDKAEHRFRPHESVRRVSVREFLVELDPGDFKAEKAILKKMIEEEWSSPKFHLRVVWAENKPGLYRFVAGLGATQSITNHNTKTITLKKFVRYRTFAHEVGHVLGFDDHYYEVWHDKYCYYTQEFRTSDLMSDAENGRVRERHWQILDSVYPWKGPPRTEPFLYTYGT